MYSIFYKIIAKPNGLQETELTEFGATPSW